MTRQKNPAGDYEVGYRKPPRHSRFKKGQSGNPKGRPKGHRNRRSIIREVLDQKVTIKMNGEQREVTFFEAFIQAMMAKGLKGSMRDQVAFLKAIEAYAPEMLKEPETPQVLTVEFVGPRNNGPGRGKDG